MKIRHKKMARCARRQIWKRAATGNAFWSVFMWHNQFRNIQ